MKAMILAAGLGARMQPLTLKTPKALLKIGNTTLIDRCLQKIKEAGIQDVVINVHHLADKIMTHCRDGAQHGLHIQYSIEDALLETGGGVFKALPLLGDEPFLVVSADVWSNYSLVSLMQKQVEAAHLVLVDNPPYHPHGDFGLDVENIVHSKSDKKFTYGNIGIFHPSLFKDEKLGVFKLVKVLHPAINQGLVTGEHYAGKWYNVGTPADLERLRNE